MIGPKANKDAEVFADAIEGRGPRNSDIRELVRFAESLCESAVDPSPDFLVDLRSQLMADAATVLVKTHTPHARRAASGSMVHPARRRVAAATAGLIGVAGMVSIVASSAQAIPGDMLYPVKRGVETVELTLHRSDASRGSFQLAQASERLAEARSLSGQTDAASKDQVSKTLAEFSDSAAAGSQALFADYNSGGDRASINQVSSFAKSSNSILQSISAELPAGSTDAFKTATTTLTDLVSQASSLCSECNISTLPTSLTSAIAKYSAPATSVAAGKPAKGVVKHDAAPTNVVGALVGGVVPPTTPAGTPAITTPTTPPVGGLAGTTKPLVGALLGDEGQVGLVPGLLNGLLGGK